MFKSAATKLAHNSTLPLNHDLRPLQDLITAEKAVILSLHRLATDLSRASESLKAWGLAEGDDLGDILAASTTILTHFTSALSQYASHGHFMREQLKSIRTREENLDQLKRRRRNVNSKADAAEKKLNRMNLENKHFYPQTELLNKLRDEIRGLDVDIMKEEASIADLKRSTTRTWVGLKFGGLIECCEKGVIAGEYGKLIVSEIPNEQTQPGLPRSPYLSHSRIGDLVAEAHRCVNEVRLSTVPSNSPPPPPQQLLPQMPHVSDYSSFMTQGTYSPSPYHTQQSTSPVIESPLPQSPQHRYSSSLSNAGLPSLSGKRVDEFGNPTDTTGGGRFATFPVKARSASTSGGERGAPPLSLSADRGQSDSFSSSVAQALAATTTLKEPEPGRFSKDGPAPSYEASVDLEQNRLSSGGDDQRQSLVEEGRESHWEEEEEGHKQVRFGRVDAIPQSSQEAESSGRTYGQGQQARLARLLENEDEEDRNEQSLNAEAAREVGLELNAPTDNNTDDRVPPPPPPTTTMTTTYTSPPESSSSSPAVARTTELERAPTYTEKPTLYHDQYGIATTPTGVQQLPYRQQQQQEYYTPQGATYGYHDSQHQQMESEFYNPYSERPGAGNLSPSMSSASQSGAYPPPLQQQQQQQQQPSSPRPGDNDNKPPRSPLYERPPNAPYMTKLETSVGERSTSSLNSLPPSASASGGGGKISAAAFKRPSPRIGSGTTGSPFSSSSGVQPLKVVNRRQELEEEGGYDSVGGYVNEGEREREGDKDGEGNGGVGVGVGTYGRGRFDEV